MPSRSHPSQTPSARMGTSGGSREGDMPTKGSRSARGEYRTPEITEGARHDARDHHRRGRLLFVLKSAILFTVATDMNTVANSV